MLISRFNSDVLGVFSYTCKIFLVEFVGNKVKRQILKRLFQENKARQTFRKTNISYPLIRTRNVRFFEKFGVLCFLETPVLRFALLPYYQRIVVVCKISFVVRNPQYVSRKKMNGIFSVEC